MKKGKLQDIPVAACFMLQRNPQYLTPHEMDSLKRSIEQDGFLAPILVRLKDKRYEIISGNHRFLAAQEAGHETIPAVIIQCDEREKKRIALNLNSIHGEPSAELLAPFLAELDDDLLAEIHIGDDQLQELIEFDKTLAERLASLEPPESLDTNSNVSIPDCVCQKCGRRHVSAKVDSSSPSADVTNTRD